MLLETEFMGFDEDIYSSFHYTDFSITLVQDSKGTLLSVTYESGSACIEEAL